MTPHTHSEDYSYKRFYQHDFSGQKLAHANFRCATVIECDFTDTDLSFSIFEGANCFRSKFINSSVYRANFRDATLAESVWEPRDARGIAITLDCTTFKRVKFSERQWHQLLFLISLAEAPSAEAAAALEALIGKERVARYATAFKMV